MLMQGGQPSAGLQTEIRLMVGTTNLLRSSVHAQLLQRDKVREMSPIELEAALRNMLLKLQYTKAVLQPLPAGGMTRVRLCCVHNL
jgi:hypothetical protein